jgi:hypothetical protein
MPCRALRTPPFKRRPLRWPALSPPYLRQPSRAARHTGALAARLSSHTHTTPLHSWFAAAMPRPACARQPLHWAASTALVSSWRSQLFPPQLTTRLPFPPVLTPPLPSLQVYLERLGYRYLDKQDVYGLAGFTIMLAVESLYDLSLLNWCGWSGGAEGLACGRGLAWYNTWEGRGPGRLAKQVKVRWGVGVRRRVGVG